jgi:hypothetical protein
MPSGDAIGAETTSEARAAVLVSNSLIARTVKPISARQLVNRKISHFSIAMGGVAVVLTAPVCAELVRQ